MNDYRFSIIVSASEMTDEHVLDAADALGAAGCTDASVRGHAAGMELVFQRAAGTLQAAIQSAVADIEGAGFHVLRVEMQREALAI